MATSTTLKVRDVMTPHPVTLPSSASLSDAARVMRDSDIGTVVVHDGKGLCGIVTDRDMVIRAIAEGKDPRKVKLDEICSHDVSGLSPDDDLDRAIATMKARAVRRLLVVDGSETLGIVSLGDLAQRLDRSSLLGEISAAPPNH
jgi:CBS domain-containing protein